MGLCAPNPAKKKKKNKKVMAPINPAVGSSLIQMGGGLFGGLFGLRAQKKQNEANKELAKYAYSKDLEMWNRGNAYNSPQAQMARLKEAGLNPALVYGSGSVAGQSAGQLPKYNAPTLDYSYVPPVQETLTNAISTYQDYQVKQAQINNLREQNKVIRESGLIKEWEAKNASRYYFNRGWKMHDERQMIGEKLMDLSRTNDWKWDGENQTNFMNSQLQFALGKVRAQGLEITNLEKLGAKLDAQTDYQNKVNEWYLTKMFSQLGISLANTLPKYLGLGKGMGGMKPPSLNQNKKKVPDYMYNNSNRMKNIWPNEMDPNEWKTFNKYR